jgi:hypothetical protein
MKIIKNCPLCHGQLLNLDYVYNRCKQCGLHVKYNFESVEITNESLNETDIKQIDGLTKFKVATVLKLDSVRIGILDIGTASGKFPYHAKKFFQRVQGIEVNPKCIDFAQKKLKIKLVTSIEHVELGDVSCVTFWHSLEHIPLEITKDIFNNLVSLKESIPILISVPNANSNQFKMFGNKWPYYDESSHLYQFSPLALNLFMSNSGYHFKEHKVGFMYELFGYLQGYVNKFHPVANYFYYRKKRGWDFNFSKSKIAFFDIYNYLLIAFFAPIALLSLFLSTNGKEGVINFVYTRKD